MTSVLENLHPVTKRKHPTPAVLEHARSFGHAMHEFIKQMSLWLVKYYVHPTSYYPVPDVGAKFPEVHKTPLIRAAPMSAVDMSFMCEWARDHGW